MHFDVKPRVDAKLGGADPFGSLDLPQDKTTDLALHHCKPGFLMAFAPVVTNEG